MSHLQNCSVKIFKEPCMYFTHKKNNYKKKIHVIRKKKEYFFFNFHNHQLINLLIILDQLTKFEAPTYNSFRDIMITNFQSPNLQREIIRKK